MLKCYGGFYIILSSILSLDNNTITRVSGRQKPRVSPENWMTPKRILMSTYSPAFCHCEEPATKQSQILEMRYERREAREGPEILIPISLFSFPISHFPIGRLPRSFAACNDNVPGKKC